MGNRGKRRVGIASVPIRSRLLRQVAPINNYCAHLIWHPIWQKILNFSLKGYFHEHI